jgi:hypothetical protein
MDPVAAAIVSRLVAAFTIVALLLLLACHFMRDGPQSG